LFDLPLYYLGQKVSGVDGGAVYSDFIVEVGAGAVAGAAHEGYYMVSWVTLSPTDTLNWLRWA